jgi:hypothetical protein
MCEPARGGRSASRRKAGATFLAALGASFAGLALGVPASAWAQPWAQEAEQTASDGAQADSFGSEVAISGTTLVVTAGSKAVGPNAQQGAAYIYSFDGAGCVLQQELTANNGAANDFFGASVAMSSSSSDTVLVGAPYKNVGPNTYQGAVYVYSFNGTSWTQQPPLMASDGAASDIFGFSVALMGGTALVGAYGKNVGSNVGQGAAYFYSWNGSAWVEQKVSASDGAANDQFGSAAAISGTTAVLGAANKTVGANAGQGAAYVFSFNGTSWVQQAELIASDGAPSDGFGGAVAVSGNTVVVGAGNKNVGTNTGEGTAYVYSFNGTNWVQQAELTPPNGTGGDFFGCEAALSGRTLVLGACDKRVGPNFHQGAAYVYGLNGSTWVWQAELTASDGAAGDYFGAVALFSNLAVVGAYGKTVGSNLNQGAAYVFVGPVPPAVPALPRPAALALVALVGVAGVWGSAKRRGEGRRTSP